MDSLLNEHTLPALLICYLINAVASGLIGAVLASRAQRPIWHGLLPGFLLPWLGLLFVRGGQLGERQIGGAAKYGATMLTVAAVLMASSSFLNWGEGSGTLNGETVRLTFVPNEHIVAALLVWASAVLLLVAAFVIGITRAMTGAVVSAMVVSVSAGLLLGGSYLFGTLGLFIPEIREAELTVFVGPGGWIAFIALVTSYVALLSAPFGLWKKPAQLPPPPVSPEPPSNLGGWGEGQQPQRAWDPSQHQQGATW